METQVRILNTDKQLHFDDFDMVAESHLTAAEFADATHSSPTTVREWIRKGLIRAERPRRQWLIPVEELGRQIVSRRGGQQDRRAVVKLIDSRTSPQLARDSTAVASQNPQQDMVEASKGPSIPSWNTDLSQLTLDGQIIRRVRQAGRATNIVAILDEFQVEGWPARVADPLPDGDHEHLRDAIKQLNVGLTKIRFRADGRGKGIIWERT
jgi:excisionase family DNA binding protein